MYARDIMTRPVISIDTGGTVREAITLLTEHGFAAIPVVDDNGRVVGILRPKWPWRPSECLPGTCAPCPSRRKAA